MLSVNNESEVEVDIKRTLRKRPEKIVYKQAKLEDETQLFLRIKKENEAAYLKKGGHYVKPPSYSQLTEVTYMDCPEFEDTLEDYCKPCKTTNRNCGPEAKCPTAAACIECSACCGEECLNQRIKRKINWKDYAFIWSSSKGHGICTTKNILKGTFINEYTGRCLKRERYFLLRKHTKIEHLYAIGLDENFVIDAAEGGSYVRFVNHSCEPNLFAEEWKVDGKPKIGFFAMRDIEEGEELTIDYEFEDNGNILTNCACGTQKCRGTIEKVKPSRIVNNEPTISPISSYPNMQQSFSVVQSSVSAVDKINLSEEPGLFNGLNRKIYNSELAKTMWNKEYVPREVNKPWPFDYLGKLWVRPLSPKQISKQAAKLGYTDADNVKTYVRAPIKLYAKRLKERNIYKCIICNYKPKTRSPNGYNGLARHYKNQACFTKRSFVENGYQRGGPENKNVQSQGRPLAPSNLVNCAQNSEQRKNLSM